MLNREEFKANLETQIRLYEARKPVIKCPPQASPKARKQPSPTPNHQAESYRRFVTEIKGL